MAIPKQPTAPQVPTQQKTQREMELESLLGQYQKEFGELAKNNYSISLKDDSFFRLELLTTLAGIKEVFQKFLDKLEESQTGEVPNEQ